jgi:beta-lactamase superfamily II metal-dependent hydrolase
MVSLARRAFLALGLATLLACATAGPPAALPPPPREAAPKLRVDFIDVGQGDATLITSPTGKTVLIDGGPPDRKSREALLSFLEPRVRGPLDLIILTHRHVDHHGGLRVVIESRGARLFLDAPTPNPGKERERLMAALERANVPVRNATPGRTVDLGGGAMLTLLTPPDPPLAGTRDPDNANSVVARLDYAGSSFLFTGDAESATERWLLARRANVRAQVLKVAHHGSRHSSEARFLAAVKPAVAVISAGTNNEYGHPAPQTLARLEAAGARILRTDLDGTVTIETDGRTLSIRTARGPRQEVSLR